PGYQAQASPDCHRTRVRGGCRYEPAAPAHQRWRETVSRFWAVPSGRGRCSVAGGRGATTDVVVVGSGPNGLAAALILARAGLEVEVHEAAADVGGGMRTAELTGPGFRHDVCSAVHPMALASPFFRAFDLAAHGV